MSRTRSTSSSSRPRWRCERYLDDPARLALSDLRDRAIARTELLRVSVVAQ